MEPRRMGHPYLFLPLKPNEGLNGAPGDSLKPQISPLRALRSGRDDKSENPFRSRLQIRLWLVLSGCFGVASWVAEDVAEAANLRSYSAEFLFDVLIAAVHVVDAVEDGFSVGDHGGENE